MKLLLNITCFQSDKLTGIERFALHIAREVARIDSSVLVASSQEITGLPNLKVSRLLSFAGSVLNKYEYPVRALWDQTLLRCLIARHKPDILYCPIQDGMFYPPVKQIVTVHDLHYLHFSQSIPECRHEIHRIRTRFHKLKMPLILERSAAVVAVSETTKRDIIAHFGISPDKIHVVYNGYDEERFRLVEDSQEILTRYGLKSSGYFLFIGSILRHKNIARLAQAFSRLHTGHRLVIVGACKDSAYLDEIRSVAIEAGIPDDRLRYLEYIPDEHLPHLYNGARAFVLPSLHEGFGVPIIEAMACGTPVITSDCSAMPEIARDAAMLVDPFSVESITAAMQEILVNPQRVESLRKAGLERASKFRWSCSAKKLYDICSIVSQS